MVEGSSSLFLMAVNDGKQWPLSPSASSDGRQVQGCQMVYFQTKNANLGKFWRALQWKMYV
jgi:hypothetical protein